MPKPLIAPENDYSSLLQSPVTEPSLSVAVVIPVYNRTELLARTLAGVAASDYPKELLSVIVADDGSDEDVATVARRFRDSLDITVVRREHQGYGAGQARNLGADAAAGSDVLVFFDADCIPDPSAVARHAHWHHLASNVVVIGSRHHIDTSAVDPDDLAADPMILRRLGFGTESPNWQVLQSDDFRATLHRRTGSLRFGDEAFRSLVSSNFSIATATFDRSGGFSSDFTRWGGEDTELGWRLWNDGAFFVDEPGAAICHQVQIDAGPEGWRAEQRHSNDGLIQSKIPHKFYRNATNTINDTPKVSCLVHSAHHRLDQLAEQLLRQRLTDLEMIVVGGGEVATRFLERRWGDPRFDGASDRADAIAKANGEFIVWLHGAAAPDHRLISRSVAAIERRPRSGLVRSAIGISHGDGHDVFKPPTETGWLAESWKSEMPIFAMARRREMAKALGAGMAAGEAWAWVEDSVDAIDHGVALIWLPSATPTEAEVEPPTSLRSEVLADLKSGGRKAATAPWRALRSAVAHRPFRPTQASPTRPGIADPGKRPSVRYVGWTGRNNLGDEAMFEAISARFSWADVSPDASAPDVVMLGGGTLINRGYLKRLRPFDSPRRERVIFGTGVANPSYWGEPKENISEWVAFIESCLFTGVRGPISAEVLADWGVRTPVEVIGDPALSLTPSAGVAPVDGRVVVCPAWARGLLWGEDDAEVISAFAGLVRRLRDEGHDVWALSAFPGDDRHIIDMMRQAGEPNLPYLAAHDNPQPALDLLASADLVVAERLHGAVLAAAVATVPVMVEYRPKLRDFARSVGLEELVIRTDSIGGLDEIVANVLARKDGLSAVMTQRVDEFRMAQERAADLIAAEALS